ncbi:MAG: hypothetical protein KatS3mg072_2127 [Meiothermus sp.]|nr:MAG: hypothetical protein KatS3mg072_2127 [Meiothermus sp.]
MGSKLARCDVLFGTLPGLGPEEEDLSELVGERIAQQLMLWALVCFAGAIFGLWRTRHGYWRPFWFMTGVWAWVNAAIAYGGWLGAEPNPASLRQLLWINAGLDTLYITVGLILNMRQEPMYKGFGLAIVLQGLFLLGFDVFHALQI